MQFPIHTRFPDHSLHVLLAFGNKYYFRVLSHLRFIRRELLGELFRSHNRKNMGTQPTIELFSPRKSSPNIKCECAHLV